MLVGTKADLLPAGADGAQVAAWLQAAAAFKRIAAVSVHLVRCTRIQHIMHAQFMYWRPARLALAAAACSLLHASPLAAWHGWPAAT